MMECRFITDLEAYSSYFDHEWAKRIMNRANNTAYDEIVFKLCFQWKGTANTSAMPHITVGMIESFANGFIAERKPYSQLFFEQLSKNVSRRVDPPLPPNMRKSLESAMISMNSEITDTLNANPYTMNRTVLWKSLLDAKEFGLALLLTQRMCYSQLFFGYEDFLVRVIQHKLNTTDVRTGPNFHNTLQKALGNSWTDRLWQCNQIRLPRLIRNALAHAGGHETKELAKVNHGIEVLDGRLQITVLHTHDLFIVLSKAIEELIDYLIPNTK